jgi:glutathione S-transferase
VLKRLNVEFDHREIDLRNKPDDFIEKSPTGKVPMITDGDFVLYESQIINDYLVEEYGWSRAYSEKLRLKHQQRVCMKQWDSVVIGPVYESLSQPDALDEQWDDIEPELEFLETIVEKSDQRTDSLFAYHFAPFWARFRWLSDYTSFPSRIDAYDVLNGWLNRILEEEPITATLPDPDEATSRYVENYVD